VARRQGRSLRLGLGQIAAHLESPSRQLPLTPTSTGFPAEVQQQHEGARWLADLRRACGDRGIGIDNVSTAWPGLGSGCVRVTEVLKLWPAARTAPGPLPRTFEDMGQEA